MNEELLIYRIMSGYIRSKVRINNKSQDILIVSPNINDLYEAEYIYDSKLNDLVSDEVQTQDEILLDMTERGQWSIMKEERLGELSKIIEDLKVEMFEKSFQSASRKNIKIRLNALKQEQNQLYQERSKYSYLSAEGLANIEKSYFLASRCAKLPDFSSFIIDLDESSNVIESIINIRNNNKIEETDYRKLCRNDLWNSYYVCGDVFGVPSVKLTEEQKNLLLYSKMYENVYQSPECPPNYVIEDDDCLDGWFISQRRKRDKDKNSQLAESKISDKISKCENIFLPAETLEDAKAIEAMNDIHGKMIKKQRNAMINKSGGVLGHQDLPEEKMKMMGILNGT